MEFMEKNGEQFEEFNYDKFCKEHWHNRKKRIFLNYINVTFGDLDKRNVLTNLNESNIIDSLKNYISIGAQSQTTARNYVTYVTQLFDELSQRYNIKNELFINKDKYMELNEKAKVLINTLKANASKDIASDEEYEAMQEAVVKTENMIDKDCVLEEVTNRDSGKHYRKLISVIATRLVLDYGLKGNVLTKIKLEDYDEKQNSIWINGITLSLSKKYSETMKMYLEARALAVSKNAIKSEMLFVNVKGNDFQAAEVEKKKKVPDYGALFCIADELVRSTAMEKYACNRIIKMISKGIDVSTLEKLTGFPINKIVMLLEYYNDEIGTINPNDYFGVFAEEAEQVLVNDGKRKYIKCPVCNKLVTVDATEWVVVKYEDEPAPILACKYCGGAYEESRI